MDSQSTNQFKLYIPSEISSDSNLNLSEMRILATIKALDNEHNCYANNSYLSECTGLSIRQVSRVIKSLETKGYIEIENGKSFKRKIKIAETTKQEQFKDTNPTKPKEEHKVVVINKPSTYKAKVSTKVQKFNVMYSHKWDFDSIERLENLKISLDLGQISKDEYKILSEPLLRGMGG